MPPEAVIRATTMTPQALYHMPEGALVHRFVLAGERARVENDERAEATRALREMLASGRLSKLIPEKDGGKIVTHLIEQDGPISYIESTTLGKVFEEDANRCLLLQTDERPAQTRRIVQAAAGAYAGTVGSDPFARGQMIDRHHTVQRMLVPQRVVIPYAGRLAELMPIERVEARRAIGHILRAIEALVILHQRQRVTDEHGHLIASRQDYEVARRLLSKSMARSLGGQMTDAAVRFFETCIAPLPVDDFDTSEAIAQTIMTATACRGQRS